MGLSEIEDICLAESPSDFDLRLSAMGIHATSDIVCLSFDVPQDTQGTQFKGRWVPAPASVARDPSVMLGGYEVLLNA